MKYLLTDVGAELLANLGVTGEGLHLTRAQAGEGHSDSPEGMTALMNGQLDMQIADLERQGTITTLTLLITNHTLQEEHKIQQIGIFAQGGEDAEEVLFIIGQDQNGDVLPSIDYGRVEYRYTVNLKISNAQNIVLDVNDTDFVLKKTFNEQVGKVDVLNKGNLQEQIDKVTVAVDEKIMKYLGAAEEGEGLGFVEGLEADNFLDAINQTFQSGSEKKARLAENLTAMGLQASASDTWEVLLNKVLDMTDTSKDTVRASVLLAGYTAHDAAGKPITGDMEECGAWTGNTTGSGNVTIPAGHHNGKGYVSGKGAYDAGVNATKKGTAVAADVLVGKTFTNNSAVGENGGMANKGGTTVDAGATMQDDTYTYLSIPSNAFYDTNSKLRTKNSNLGADNFFGVPFILTRSGSGSSNNSPNTITLSINADVGLIGTGHVYVRGDGGLKATITAIKDSGRSVLYDNGNYPTDTNADYTITIPAGTKQLEFKVIQSSTGQPYSYDVRLNTLQRKY